MAEEKVIGNVQLGKQGITDNFIASLIHRFKTHKNIKVSVLKSARPEGKEGKKQVREYADTILEGLGNKFTARIIGFTINLKKWRKPQR